MKKILIFSLSIVLFLSLLLLFTSSTEARSGCCSWHGGVCTYQCPGGGTGYRCCDGTSLSATCAPYYSSCSTVPVNTGPKITYKTEKVTKKIPYKSIERKSDKIDKGDLDIKRLGEDGKKVITYRVTYKDGKEVSREKTKTVIKKKPVDEIVLIGTKEPEKAEGENDNNEGEVAGAEEKSELTFWDWIGMFILFVGIPAGIIWLVVWLVRKRSKSSSNKNES